jgi:GntR family transcriptional regulator
MALSETSNYRAVAAQIRADIQTGTYPRGSELPLQAELAQRYGTAQSTVSKALKVLAAEGIIQPIRGKRTIVTPIPPIHRNPSLRYSKAARERAGARGAYDAEVRALGMEPRSDKTIRDAVPPANVADILGVDADSASTVVHARVMWADDTITQLADSYLPKDLAEGTVLSQIDTGPGGMISRMAELGFAQVEITESIQGRPATPEEARALQITEDQHVYVVTHVGRTAEGRAVEVTIHTMPQHLWILEATFTVD